MPRRARPGTKPYIYLTIVADLWQDCCYISPTLPRFNRLVNPRLSLHIVFCFTMHKNVSIRDPRAQGGLNRAEMIANHSLLKSMQEDRRIDILKTKRPSQMDLRTRDRSLRRQRCSQDFSAAANGDKLDC